MGVGWNEVNFTSREVCDIRTSSAKAVTLLGLLLSEIEAKRRRMSRDGEVDFHCIGLGHPKAEFLRLFAHLIVIHREAGRENGGVHSVHGCATETVLFREGGQGCRCGEGGDAKDEVVLCADVTLERECIALRVDTFRWKVEVAAAGHGVRVKGDGRETEFLHDSGAERIEKAVVGVVLDEEGAIREERVVFHVCRILKVDEDGDALSAFWMKHGVKETLEVKLGKGSSAVGVFEMGHRGLDG